MMPKKHRRKLLILGSDLYILHRRKDTNGHAIKAPIRNNVLGVPDSMQSEMLSQGPPKRAEMYTNRNIQLEMKRHIFITGTETSSGTCGWEYFHFQPQMCLHMYMMSTYPAPHEV